MRQNPLATLLDISGARRTVLAGLAALGLGAAALPAAGKKKNNKKSSNKSKKVTFCLNGQEVKAKEGNAKKKRRLRNEGATKGKCDSTPACTPTCTGCGGSDGCGGTCGCASGSICVQGACTACTVTCNDTPLACGALLQAVMSAAADGDEIYICPGRYTPNAQPGFTFSTAISFYGAGKGDDPTVDTIIDAAQASFTGGFYSVTTPPTGEIAFTNLRVTGSNQAPGISVSAWPTTISGCAIVDNSASGGSGVSLSARLTMENTLVSGNTATMDGSAAGISLVYVGATAPIASTITNSVITDNHGVAYGGIAMFPSLGQMVTLVIDSATQVTDNTITDTNIHSDRAGGISKKLIAGGQGTITVNGTTISGNTNPQCYDVAGCS